MGIKSYAKINLTLDVIRKLDDGYHQINSVMQQVDLADEVELEKIDGGIVIECSDKSLENEENIAYKAALLLKNKFNIDGIKIKIQKNIPIAAGLGGGSSNAAAVLKGTSKLFSLDLSEEELIKLGTEIGMDVPFSIVGGTCHVKGKGEAVEKIDSLNGFDAVIVNNGIKVSTKEAYTCLKLKECGLKKSTEKLINTIQHNNNINGVVNNLHNDFEFTILKKYPEINEIKDELKRNGALNALMSGSGPTVFGFFENKEKAKECYEKIKDDYGFVYLGKTI